MEPVPLFVELFAGTAALSLRLQRRKARPPVSRMGSKQGYADAILSRLGLLPGQRAHRYVWCEPDAGCQLLLYAYTRPDVAREAAEIIRSWAPGDPRKVWEWLRAEGPVKGPTPREVARWSTVQGWAYAGTGMLDPAKCGIGNVDSKGRRWGVSDQAWVAGRLDALPDCPALILPSAEVDPREVARWLRIVSSNRLINLDPETWQNTGAGGSTFGGSEFCTDAGALADALALPQMPAAVAQGADVDPREVARWAWVRRRSAHSKGDGYHGGNETHRIAPDAPAEAMGALPALTPGPVDCDGVTLPAGTVAYLDPPYYQTTTYAHDIPRPEGEPYRWVEDIARRWSEAGATVAISEAVPMPGLVAEGWHAVEITHERKGQKRTFSKQKREWLTMNKPPAGQQSLWG